MRIFTTAELRNYNGCDGRPVYVAFEGKVYDLSKSFLWQGGEHEDHPAGLVYENRDLSEAPHGRELLATYPIVGILAEYARKELQMDVIKILEDAIEAEKNAQAMYKKGAEVAEDAETRALFEQLTNWEEGHERLLKDRLATLKLMKSE